MAHRPEGFLCIYGFSMFKISAYPADVLDKGKNLFFAEAALTFTPFEIKTVRIPVPENMEIQENNLLEDAME